MDGKRNFVGRGGLLLDTLILLGSGCMYRHGDAAVCSVDMSSDAFSNCITCMQYYIDRACSIASEIRSSRRTGVRSSQMPNTNLCPCQQAEGRALGAA